MILLSVKFDSKEINKILNNSVSYSEGFLEGIQSERIEFNRFLGGYTVEALEKYIDSKARINPNALHHVYEWNRVGNEKARLFKFSVKATKNNISILGSFLPSKSISPTSDEPFVDKASIMENGISIVIQPKRSNILVFESEGETVFTRKSIVIEHPGGDDVANSFGETVDSFFTNYFTNSLLKPFIMNLQKANEYTKNFKSGTKGGRSVGVRAGRQYLRAAGVVFE